MDQDSDLLLTIVPEVVWMEVFNKCAQYKRYKDIENGINSSLFFRNLLKKKRTTMLFPNIFPIFRPKYDEYWHKANNDKPEDERDGNKNSDSKHSFLFKMRLTCKTWKTAINDYHQNLSHQYKLGNDYYPVKLGYQNFVPFDYGFDSQENFEFFRDQNYDYGDNWCREIIGNDKQNTAKRFINHYSGTHNTSVNPFNERSIEISNDGDFNKGLANQKDYEFWDAITTILEKYGEFIWYCYILLSDKFPTRVEYYRRIKQWLELLPNVKVLQISYNVSYPSKRELIQLKKEILDKPLPTLKSLKCLKIRNVPDPILNELVKQNKENLRSADIQKEKRQVEYDIISVPLPNLKELSLEVWSINEIRKLNNWKLEKIHLDRDWDAGFMSWATLFKLIKQKWGDTLTDLMINLSGAMKESEKKNLWKRLLSSEHFKLELPNIKRFKLIVANKTPIDFILPMKNSLEVLELAYPYMIRKPKYGEESEEYLEDEQMKLFSQQIEIVGYEDRLYDSNIWELFPKLERIQVWEEYEGMESISHVDWVYTREEWERKMKVKSLL